jgi:hypothetical protein
MLGMLGVHSTFESELDDDEELEEGVTLLVFLKFCFLGMGIMSPRLSRQMTRKRRTWRPRMMKNWYDF